MIDAHGRDWVKTILGDGRSRFAITGASITFRLGTTDAQALPVFNAMLPGPPDPVAVKAAENASQREQARAFLLTDPRPEMKALRALALVTLEEINRLRTQPAQAFAAYTVNQLLDAVIAKITAGSAD